MHGYYWKDDKLHNKTSRVSEIRNALNIGPDKQKVKNWQLLELSHRQVAGSGIPKSSLNKGYSPDKTGTSINSPDKD